MYFNFFALQPLIVAFLSIALGINAFLRNKRSQLNSTFLFMSICVFIWLFFVSMVYFSHDLAKILMLAKMAYVGVTFLPTSIFHFTVVLLHKDRIRKFLVWFYAYSLFFAFLLFTPFYADGLYSYSWGCYLKAGLLNPVQILYHFIIYIVLLGWLFYSGFLDPKNFGLEKTRIRFVFVSLFIASFAAIDFGPSYGFDYLPFGNIFIFAWLAVTAYAIAKYRLMDINVVLTRTSIFIFVYSLVLGLPFFVAFGLQDWLKSFLGDIWWLSPLILLTVLATGGPFIYMAIQKKAEEKLFADQRRYQMTLRNAATGMGRIKDMERLVGLIVHIVTRSVRVEHSMIFLKDPSGKKYKFEGGRARQEMAWTVKELDAKSPLVRALNKVQQPIVYSELKQRAADNPETKLGEVADQIESLNAELIVPSFIDENLIAFMVLGRKLSGELYSNDDIAVFSILASQAALAIENCQFYRDMRATHAQLFQAEKMATIGIMADGLSHQINNRLHALGFIAGDALDTIVLKKNLPMSDELKEIMVDLEHALTRIQDNVAQGGEIVRGLLKYSRHQDQTVGEVDLDELIDESLKMAEFKIRKDSMHVVRDFPAGLPKIRGNFTQLQEVFFNLIDNAYDAMVQRKEDLKEEGFKPTLEIKAEARAGKINLIIKDNGIGIKAEDQSKVFTPFFTTKLSSKKGTGLGLYVIRKLIEENHKGKVVYRSEYGHGTRVYVTLPTCGA